MISFPSTLNTRVTSTSHSKFDISRLRTKNINTDRSLLSELYKPNNINVADFGGWSPEVEYYKSKNIKDPYSTQYYENIYDISGDLIDSFNTYKFVYDKRLRTLTDAGKVSKDKLVYAISETAVSPALFNPLFCVQSIGMVSNVPLLNDSVFSAKEKRFKGDPNLSNCSIRELVSLSTKNNSILGAARYRTIDFMYCKDLGKVPNNRLLTLRRFAHPVGDNIFEYTNPKFANGGLYDFSSFGDVGRLVAWFDTEDNKLENIINFNYQMSWRELKAKIEEQDSQEDNKENGGILGPILQAVNPHVNKAIEAGTGGANSLWAQWGGKLISGATNGMGRNIHMMRNYDNNKVYEPKNTIQDTHIYEGKLTFQNEITLVFSYKLRAYDNINPKSAFLDLLGNILIVSYKRGKFWGGDRKLIGTPQSTSQWKTVNAFIDNAWERLGGMMQALASGGMINFKEILASIGGMAETLKNKANEMAGNLGGVSGSGLVNKVANWFLKMNEVTGFSHAIKGMLKNVLGRPALYAWQSLLSGDNVGLWHLTVGNPKNPIVAMGNLILTDANIQQFGPLGLDDFPTELKVTLKLKHGRSRDATEMGRMWTKGTNSLYLPTGSHPLNDFYGGSAGFDETEFENTQAQVRQMSADLSPKDVQAEAVEKAKTAEKATTNGQNTNNETTNTEQTEPPKPSEAEIRAKNEAREEKIKNQPQTPDLVSQKMYESLGNYKNEDTYYTANNPFIDTPEAHKLYQQNQWISESTRIVVDEIS